MRIFIDSDVILDYLYERKNFSQNARTIIALIEKGIVKGYVSSLILWNIFYILSKYLGEKEARKKIKLFRSIINIIPVDGKIIDLGLNSDIKDFEDSIQYFAAKTEGVDIFVTRNKKDYPKHSIALMSPAEFLTLIRSEH